MKGVKTKGVSKEQIGKEPAFTEKDLSDLWKEKYNFRISKLGVSEEKAREWTDRTIRGIKEIVHKSEEE